MSLRLVLATAVLMSFPLSASAQTRTLASGVLDASWNSDFACSVVNKSETEAIAVAVILKDEGGMIARNPFTNAPAILTATLAPGEAATLEAFAWFAGLTSLYCWAEVPAEASAFGSFMVRDSADSATAATPLKEDVALAARSVLEELDAVQMKIDDGFASRVTQAVNICAEVHVLGGEQVIYTVPADAKLTVEYSTVNPNEGLEPSHIVVVSIVTIAGGIEGSFLAGRVDGTVFPFEQDGRTMKVHADPGTDVSVGLSSQGYFDLVGVCLSGTLTPAE